MKHIIFKIFRPNKILGSLICLTATILLVCVFKFRLEHTVIAGLAYLYSTYALIIFVNGSIKFCKFISDFIRKNSKLYRFYHQHLKTFEWYYLILGLIVNLIYGAGELALGIYYGSWWFITLAIYYLLLCLMKVDLVRNFKQTMAKQRSKLLYTGLTLLLMDAILAGMIILIVHSHQRSYYEGYLIYLIALYDFYLIINAITNVFRHRKDAEPVIFASKCINLTVAMVSMISLEVAMIYTFGASELEFMVFMTTLMGVVVTVINSIMALLLIIKSRQQN